MNKKVTKSNELLKVALEDEERIKHKLCVIFVNSEKFPGLKGWQDYAHERQSRRDIKTLFNKKGNFNSGYSYFTGINGLIDVDFDWEFAYHVAIREFGERMNTRTLKTPSGGYRALFIVDKPQDFLEFKDRPPHVEIHGKPSHQVVVFGKGKDDKGQLKDYKLLKDVEIKKDADILEDMAGFLKKINEECHFLEYPCIKSCTQKKHNELTQEQRTAIGAFFTAENIDIEKAIDFFRCTDDFDYQTTQYHLQKIYEKKFQHPTCEKLHESFNHDEGNCKNCKRRNTRVSFDANEKTGTDVEEFKIELSYPSGHLLGFNNLKASTRLFGDEYNLIFKALWYNQLSSLIATKSLTLGQIRTDGRISTLWPIKSGGGKESIKNTIKGIQKALGFYCSEPTSLHAEQLVGKVVRPSKKNGDYEKIEGFLADDYIIIDEAFNLLTSKELHYSEARKYIRTALDPYPHNTVTKRPTDIPREYSLSYEPKCPITLFVQPFQFENDLLVMEGDIRRLMIPYVKMIGIDRTDAFKRRILNNNNDSKSLQEFCDMIKKIKVPEEFEFTEEGRNVFVELSLDLRDRGFNYSEKIKYFTDNMEFTIQNFLLKFAVVQALQDDTGLVDVKHVELAYIDLFEILEHTYQFIEVKIPGFMNYGEGWQGALMQDQDALRWLHKQGATSFEESKVSIGDYQDEIQNIFDKKERQARNIMEKQIKKGWIKKKKGYQESTVWLNFKPTSTYRQKRQHSPYTLQNGNINKENIKYYKIIKKYYNILFPLSQCVAGIATMQNDIDNEISTEGE